MTTYLVTGGLGFLGQHIVKALAEHDPGAELRVLGRSRRKTLLGVEELANVRWIQGDLLVPETFAHELEGVDVVIHNAALVAFRRSDAEKIYQANVVGTRNLTKAALAGGCNNFIFISSISALGPGPNGGAVDERCLPDLECKRQDDMYGYSKCVSEAELRELTDRMRIIILNPSVVLGPGSDRIEAVMRVTRCLPVLPMLSYINSFVDARDVARAVILALTEGRSGERYIVTAHHMDTLAFAASALSAAGRRTLLFRVAGAGVRCLDALVSILDLLKLNAAGIRRPSDMAVDKILSNEKIRREMGWEPAYTLEQSIADSVGR